MKEFMVLVLFIPLGLLILSFASFVVREPEVAAFLALVGIGVGLGICVLGK